MVFKVSDFFTLATWVRKFLFSFFIISFAFPQIVLAKGVAEIQQLCAELTPANKSIASQAGYDLDQLCGNLQSEKIFKKAQSSIPITPRETVSSIDKLSKTVAPLTSAETGDLSVDRNLKPFGYDLFANAPSTFAPSAGIPVSGDYLLGPGDSLDILFYGKVNNAFSLEINREGFVDFPELGPVGLAGLTYAEAKEMLRARISAQIIGTQVSISMGTLRSMQIFVLGEAFKPGAYTVSSLSTITHALISSGGISDIGSLRNIHLKRKGKTVAVLDLYDLLLLGDTTHDLRLQAADVIFIPTVGKLVSIGGEVLRPAIYELKGDETVADLVALAGGFGSKAFAESSKLQRVNATGFLTVVDLNLQTSRDKDFKLRSGDYLSIGRITEYKKDIVTLSGAVRHGGDIAWREELRITDVISSPKKLMPDADLSQVVLAREIADKPDISVSIIDLEKALNDPSGYDNILLQSRDEIIIFSQYENRAEKLAPYVAQLQRQSGMQKVAKVVSSGGHVRNPGEYPLAQGMTVRDLIVLSGGLLESGYSQSAEISSVDLTNPEEAKSTVTVIDLGSAATAVLKPLDRVEFRKMPNFNTGETISLEGEFVFPGIYALTEGETLSSVVRRAGGVTDKAFGDGVVFLRESLRFREEKELRRLTSLIDQQQALTRLNDGSDTDLESRRIRASELNSVSLALANVEAIGRLVINFTNIMEGSREDPILQDNDRLLMPKRAQEVTVIGEVHQPMSHFYEASLSRDQYIKKSGDLKRSADKSRIYIVRSSGEAIMPRRGLKNLFGLSSAQIIPGDTIVVPIDQREKIKGIPLLAEVSQIIYQLSLGAAAVNALDAN